MEAGATRKGGSLQEAGVIPLCSVLFDLQPGQGMQRFQRGVGRSIEPPQIQAGGEGLEVKIAAPGIQLLERRALEERGEGRGWQAEAVVEIEIQQLIK